MVSNAALPALDASSLDIPIVDRMVSISVASISDCRDARSSSLPPVARAFRNASSSTTPGAAIIQTIDSQPQIE
jgi:hypothetical protein